MVVISRFNFTLSSLNKVTWPKSGHRDHWDAVVAGLMCRFTKTGGAFYLSKWADGGQRWIRIGSHPETTVKVARAQALEKLTAINRGDRPWETRKVLKAEATLGDLWAHYFATHAAIRKKASSATMDAGLWRTVLEPWGSKKRVGSITKGEVQKLMTKGADKPILMNRVLALLSTMFTVAAAAEMWTGNNPTARVKKYPEKSRDRFLAAEELRPFFQSLAVEPEAWRLYFLCAVLSGGRKSNLLAMTWADLDMHRAVWRVDADQSKNGEAMTIVLPPQLVLAINEWKPSCPSPKWVFPSVEGSASGHVAEPSRPWRRVILRAESFRLLAALGSAENWPQERLAHERTAVDVEAGRLRLLALGRRKKVAGDPLALALAEIQKRVRKAGLDAEGKTMLDVHIHDLRRTLGSWQALAGSSLAIIGRSLGHRDRKSAEVYGRLTLDPVRLSVEGAADAMLKAAGEVP